MVVASYSVMNTEANMNIPIREQSDEKQDFKRSLMFEFEIGYYDECDKCRKMDKIEVTHTSKEYLTLNY